MSNCAGLFGQSPMHRSQPISLGSVHFVPWRFLSIRQNPIDRCHTDPQPLGNLSALQALGIEPDHFGGLGTGSRLPPFGRRGQGRRPKHAIGRRLIQINAATQSVCEQIGPKPVADFGARLRRPYTVPSDCRGRPWLDGCRGVHRIGRRGRPW